MARATATPSGLARASGTSSNNRLSLALTRRRNSWCNACGYWELGLAYEQAGQPESALAVYKQVANDPGTSYEVLTYLQWSLPPSLRRLGELHEARGERAKALDYHRRLVELWKDADPKLQPVVRDVHAWMARLASEH